MSTIPSNSPFIKEEHYSSQYFRDNKESLNYHDFMLNNISESSYIHSRPQSAPPFTYDYNVCNRRNIQNEFTIYI